MDRNHDKVEVDQLHAPSLKLIPLMVRLLFSSLLSGAIIFLSSGRLDWGMAWAFLMITTIYTLFNRLTLFRKSPDLIDERARAFKHKDVKKWDRVLMPFIALVGPVAILTVAGLDKRWGWSPVVPLWIQVAALAIMVLGGALAHWAVISNKFFSGVVRIQKERGHCVISTGPYRIIRHPGYAGGIPFNLAMPVALGSLWGMIPAGITVALTIVRTALEDLVLQKELEGYLDYTKRVRCRLFPGIW